jgi:outer membrane protein OmpA-like peptidoglycan-associated protein/tetratricopeptide (TPR) repeat protein
MYRTFAFLLSVLLLGACTYTMKIQDGAMAIDRKQYAVAIPMLQKEFRKADSRIERGKIAYLIGQAYDGLNQGADALSWYKTAYDNQAGIDALKAYAYALKQNEQYQEAALAFKELGLEIGSPYEYRKEIRACEVVAEWAKETRQEYQVTPFVGNSAAADYAPVTYGEDQLLVTSDRASAAGDDTYNWTGKSFSDIFSIDLQTGSATPFGSGINTEANEGTPALSPDGNTLYFTRCTAPKGEDAYCKIYRSQRAGEGDSWLPAEALPFQRAGINYMHPALSADGRTLYFSSDDSDGWGGFDIYASEQTEGSWGDPQLLSRSVNSPGNEQFPQLDGDTLYFASEGHTGMGGLDIFRSYQLASSNWAPPINLKPPVNSGSDDFGFIVDRRRPTQEGVLAQGWFSSRRGEVGSDDIYQYQKIELPPLPEPEVPEEIVYKNILDVYVVENIYEDPTDPNSRILGRRPLPGAQLTITLGKEARTVEIDESGKVSLQLQDNSLYDFFASKETYLNNEARFSSIGLGKDPNNPVQTYEVEILLDRIFRDQEIVLENIYYDFDEWYIREDAQPTLRELATILERNPEIRIQLGSHTDCRGQDRYNAELSQKRAQSAVDFLIQEGIDPNRLAARGYGESEPAVDCICSRCTEEEHQANRRTTFKILE